MTGGAFMNEKNHILSAQLGSLCVYRELLEDEVIAALRSLLSAETEQERTESYAAFFFETAKKNCTESLAGYISEKVLYSDCPFSRQAARGEASAEMRSAAQRDLAILYQCAFLKSEDIGLNNPQMPCWLSGEGCEPLGNSPWNEKITELESFHRANSFGIFAQYKAFAWRDDALTPLSGTDPIRLSSLKGYEAQQKPVVENTISFLEGLPANNVLLYGDRGTGKSSTIHAILNEFAPRGLRMVDMPKSAICCLPRLIGELSLLPLKFIVFIDDLSFAADDDSFAELKAALEGGLAAHSDNMLIYATSNRRHLIREKFSDRDGDELHAADARQEQMSLSDRFGLSITFVNPDRARFFTILDSLAAERGISADPERLHKSGEKWALENGGRSPRTARQFINHLQAAVSRGLEW